MTDTHDSVIFYNKLIRDRIPEIIQASGKDCVCEILSDDQYIEMLDAKLNEELAEYQESKSMEELADLLEVIRAVALARGSSIAEVEAIRVAKAEKRGGFEKKLLLKEVREKSSVPVYQKTVDWSLFKDGFAIPLKIQDYFQSAPALKTKSGENRMITLIINGKPCSAELRNLPIDREKNPNHAPVLQVRYHTNDSAAEAFRIAFAQCWQDMCFDKKTTAPKKHLRSESKDYFCMYTTDDPTTFLIECFPTKESDRT